MEAASLTTYAGSEFVVAVSHENGGCCGGLASFAMPQAIRELGGEKASVPDRVRRFLHELNSSCVGGGAVATIAGGANVLGTLPARMWGPWALSTAETIAELVRSSGITVTHTEVGGVAPRRITLDLIDGVVQIEASRQVKTREEGVTQEMLVAAGKGCDWPVDIGEVRVQRFPDRLVAILGSCVGIALFDPTTRIGGLAHVVLPRSPRNASNPRRYVDTALPLLIDQLKREGARTERLQAKLAGGASGLAGNPPCFQTGTDNIHSARECLARAGIPILAEHVGGRTGRKIVMDLRSFRVSVQWLEAGG